MLLSEPLFFFFSHNYTHTVACFAIVQAFNSKVTPRLSGFWVLSLPTSLPFRFFSSQGQVQGWRVDKGEAVHGCGLSGKPEGKGIVFMITFKGRR